MDITFCYYIDMIAAERNLSKAAQKLFITQSALSQQLGKMEAELGTKLFIYAGNQMNLTPAGEVFLQTARKIIETKEQAYQEIANLSRLYTEHISIAVSRQTGTLLLSQVLPLFKQKFPYVKFDIDESDTHAAMQHLLKGTVDLALMGKTDTPHTLVKETLLYHEEVVLIFSRQHPLAKDCPSSVPTLPLPLNLQDFHSDDFILSKAGTHFRKLADAILKKHHIIPNIFCEINNFFAVQNLVENGYGIAFLNKSLIRSYDKVAYISMEPPFLYPIVISHHKTMTTKLSDPMKYLINIMIDYGATLENPKNNR